MQMHDGPHFKGKTTRKKNKKNVGELGGFGCEWVRAREGVRSTEPPRLFRSILGDVVYILFIFRELSGPAIPTMVTNAIRARCDCSLAPGQTSLLRPPSDGMGFAFKQSKTG